VSLVLNMAANNPIILDKPEDWPNWIDSIRGAISDDIWAMIDPDLEVHEELEPAPSIPKPQDVEPSKSTFLSLTATERNAYDMMFKIYSALNKKHETQMKGLTDAKILIQSRVSPGKSLLLRGNQSAREWLTLLKTASSTSKGFIALQASERYQNIVRRSPTPTAIGKWLSLWERAMAEGIRHNIADVSDGRWLRDLAKAIKPLSEALYIKFMDAATDDAQANAETYLKVSSKINEMIRSDPPKGRVTRGTTFAAEFDGELNEDDVLSEMEVDDKENTRKRAGTISALKGAPKDKKIKTSCKACGQNRHDLTRCFYAFPELRFKGFKPNKKSIAKATEALKDPELAKEVERIRKEANNEE
jgi:hypothetical protein